MNFIIFSTFHEFFRLCLAQLNLDQQKLSQIIVEQLIEKIQSGEFKVGEKIPTELELIETLK